MDQWKKNLYASWAGQILSVAGFGFMLPFIPYFIQEVGITDPLELRKWVGLTSSIAALTMGAMAPVWGILADKFGRKLMILRAMAFGVIILLLMSGARSVEAIFVLRLVQGIFTGTITASATLVASGTPKERLSYALGFLSSSTFIGFSTGPLLGGFAAEYFGYRTAFLIGGLVLVCAFLIILIFTREVKSNHAAEKVKKEVAAIIPAVRRMFVLMFALLFVIRFSRALPSAFLPLFVQESRGTIQGASVITGIISALLGVASAIAGLTLARFGDRYNKIVLIGIFLCIGAALSLPLFFTNSLWGFTLFYVLTALALGGVEPNLQSYLAEHTPPSRRGLLFGVQTSVGSMGWFASPLVSSVISIQMSIRHIFLFFAIFIFVAFLFDIIIYAIQREQSKSMRPGKAAAADSLAD